MPHYHKPRQNGHGGSQRFAALLSIGLATILLSSCVPVIKGKADSLNNWRDGSIYGSEDFTDFQPFMKKSAKPEPDFMSEIKSEPTVATKKPNPDEAVAAKTEP
ncbi:MAG: hypothetical protein ORO03_08080, partial [Alphaproteobacteria bacterium]|nr:hypothetical protein [Alphaproteobacteria bacterium]